MTSNRAVLLHASWFCSLGLGLFGPLYALFAQRVGGDVLSTSGAWAAYAFAMGALTICLARLSDQGLNKQRLIPAGYALFAASSASYLLVQDPIGLIGAQVLVGAATAVNDPPWNALFSLTLARGREGWQWGYWQGTTSTVIGVAALAGGLIVEGLGFSALFIVMTLVHLAAMLTSFRLGSMARRPRELLSNGQSRIADRRWRHRGS